MSFGEERGRAFDEDEAERADGIRVFVGRAAQVLEAGHGHARGARAELKQPRAVHVVHRAHDRPEPCDELCVGAKSSDKKTRASHGTYVKWPYFVLRCQSSTSIDAKPQRTSSSSRESKTLKKLDGTISKRPLLSASSCSLVSRERRQAT